jgi:acyl-CoA synthetase (AMP-forming)/AMP-acid ligase II
MTKPHVGPNFGLVLTEATRPLPHQWRSVASILELGLARCPDADALIDRNNRYSYRQLDAAVSVTASALWAQGTRPGERVAACLGNHCEIVIAFLAVQRIGAIWVGINRMLAPAEKAFLIRDCSASIFLADATTFAQIVPLRDDLPQLSTLLNVEPRDSGPNWVELFATRALDVPPGITINPFAPAAIAYTSGTTGHPKGAVHSQHNMMVVAATFHLGLRGDAWTPRLRHGVSLPLTILNMMVLDVVKPISGGGTCVCMDRSDAIGIAEWVAREGIEVFTASPTTAFDFVTRPEIDPSAFASVKFVASGGMHVPDDLAQRFHARFGRRLTGVYGLTEAPTSIAGLISKSDLAAPESCGRAYEHLQVAILDEQDRELPTGETGEIGVRAAVSGPYAGLYTPMLGYWGNQAESTNALRNGWLHTGDVGFLDTSGNLFVKDRRKELIIRGGANVYPAEVERVIGQDPRVRAAAVVARPDERLGEVVCAFIELAGEFDERIIPELKARCADQLARYKVPETWTILPQLPRNAMNKVAKTELKLIAAKLCR